MLNVHERLLLRLKSDQKNGQFEYKKEKQNKFINQQPYWCASKSEDAIAWRKEEELKKKTSHKSHYHRLIDNDGGGN